MSLFDQLMDQVIRTVREDRLPVAYQFSAARMIDERQVAAVAEWLEEATNERIREALEHIVFAGSWGDDDATIQAIQTVQQDPASAPEDAPGPTHHAVNCSGRL